MRKISLLLVVIMVITLIVPVGFATDTEPKPAYTITVNYDQSKVYGAQDIVKFDVQLHNNSDEPVVIDEALFVISGQPEAVLALFEKLDKYSLAPGESATAQLAYTIPDHLAHSFQVTAIGKVDDKEVSFTPTGGVIVAQKNEVVVTVTSEAKTFEVGKPITYKFKVESRGNAPITLKVWEPSLRVIFTKATWESFTPGAVKEYQYIHTPTSEDAKRGKIVFKIDAVNTDNEVLASGSVTQTLVASNSIFGPTRYETSVAISKETFTKASTVVLAYGDDFPDALAGVPLAYALNAPLLLTKTDEVPKAVLEEIVRIGATKIVVLGQEGVVSADVTKKLQSLGLNVERIGGTTRFETAAKIATRVKALTGSTSAFVTSGYSYADALSAGPAAALHSMPILLTSPTKNPDVLLSTIEDLGINKLVVLGGEKVIPTEIMLELKALVTKTTRLAGSTRFETGVAIVKEYMMNYVSVAMANANAYADALSGGVYCAINERPLLLVNTTGKINDMIAKFITDYKVGRVTFFGGELAIPTAVKTQVINLIK